MKLVLLLLLASCSRLLSAETAGSSPNILLILADDLGCGDVRCYTLESKVPTPNIDRLASERMIFTSALSHVIDDMRSSPSVKHWISKNPEDISAF